MGEKINGKLAREYIAKFPDIKTNFGLARKLYKDFPTIYGSVEAARGIVRHVKGASGQFRRKQLTDKSLYTESVFEKILNEIPDTQIIVWDKYKLPSTCKTIGLIGDLHIPFIDNDAVKAAYKYFKKSKIDTLLINGDILDCQKESKFVVDPNARDSATELQMMWDFLIWTKKVLGKNVKIFIKLGNHEERTEKYLISHAPEIYNKAIWRLKDLHTYFGYDLVEDFIDNKRIVMAGDLPIIHGHEIGLAGSDYANSGRTLWLKVKHSCICNHLHSTNEHTEPDLFGKIKTTWTVGCLCQLRMTYRPINRWNHGFAVIHLDDKGFKVENKRIYNGITL
jgi:predicted phosphodiesterase